MQNPFETEQLVICSLDSLRKKRRRFLSKCWKPSGDLLVVDHEAHHHKRRRAVPMRWWALAEQVHRACCC